MFFPLVFPEAKRLDYFISFPTRNVLLATKIGKMLGIAKQNGENIENAIKLQIGFEITNKKTFYFV